jgi:hypothetical protein
MILMYDLILFLQPPDPVLHPLHLATACLLEVPPQQLPLSGQLVPRGEDDPLARQLVELAEEEGLERCSLFATGVICWVRLKIGVCRNAILNSLLSLFHRGGGCRSESEGALGELAVNILLPVTSLPLQGLCSGSSLESYPVPGLPGHSLARPD